MKIIKFIAVFLVYYLFFGLIFEGIIWTELVMKPYTPVGAFIMTWAERFIAVVISFLATIAFTLRGKD